MTYSEINGGTFAGEYLVNLHVGLYLDPTFDPGMTDRERDSVVKVFAGGVRFGLSRERIGSLRWGCHQARIDSPAATVVDVRVVLSDGDHDFTWEEFEAWLAGAPAHVAPRLESGDIGGAPIQALEATS